MRREIGVISEFMTLEFRKRAIAIHISNISRSKGNQTMKFGQLIEYNVRNIYHKNHTQNVAEKLFSDPSLKNQN